MGPTHGDNRRSAPAGPGTSWWSALPPRRRPRPRGVRNRETRCLKPAAGRRAGRRRPRSVFGCGVAELVLRRPELRLVLLLPLQPLDGQDRLLSEFWLQQHAVRLDRRGAELVLRVRPVRQRPVRRPARRAPGDGHRRLRYGGHEPPVRARRVLPGPGPGVRHALLVHGAAGDRRLHPGLRRPRHGQDEQRLVRPGRAGAVRRHFRPDDQRRAVRQQLHLAHAAGGASRSGTTTRPWGVGSSSSSCPPGSW